MKPFIPQITTAKRQQGALGLLGVLTLLLAILFTALAVDTGRLYLEERRLQTIADMAALDAASAVGHCGDGDVSAAQTLANQSAARNNHIGETPQVELGIINVRENGVREFSVPEDITEATSVAVTINQTVPASLFAGGILGNEVNLQTSAVARRNAIANFSLGSNLANIDSQQSALLNGVLGDVLGSSLNLNAVTYNGIASTQIELADLASVATAAGTVEGLLDSNVTLASALQLYADALNASDVADVGVANAVDDLVSATVNNLTVSLSDVLLVTSESFEDALNAQVNLLELITTSAFVANGSNAISLPNTGINLPAGLLNVATSLQITEPPQIAIGPPGLGPDIDGDGNADWRTEVSTAQVKLRNTVQSTIGLNILGLASVRANIDLALDVNVAQGRAWLESIDCPGFSDEQLTVVVGVQPGIASIGLSQASDPDVDTSKVDLSAVLLILRVPVANVDVGLNLPLQNPDSTSVEFTFDKDADNLPLVESESTSLAGALSNLEGGLVLDVELIGINLGFVGAITEALLDSVLVPLLDGLVANLIEPLLELLGVTLGRADVQLIDVEISRPEIQR